MHIERKIRVGLKNFLWWLREIFGDAEYEKYLRRSATESRTTGGRGNCDHHHIHGTVSAERFYMDRIERQYARVSRCC